MTTPQRPPKDGIRAMPPGSLEGDGKTLTGRLATGWAEIESVAEGHFMERFATPGAFRKAFSPDLRGQIKVLFQHGRDNQLNQQPIAVLTDAGEDRDGAFYRARLLDGIPPLILDGLREGVYGSSHTFRVIREDWNPKPDMKDPAVKARNPKGLPERVVKEAHIWELGPVTWPSYGGQTVARSLSDEFSLATLTADPERLRELVAYIDPDAPSVDAGAPPHLPERSEAVAPPTIQAPERNPKLSDQYVTRDEKSSRVTELKQALARQAVEYPGVLPADAQATWDADSKEVDDLERDIKAWDERQERLKAYAADETKTERTFTPPQVIRRPTETDIYDLDAVFSRSRSPEQRAQTLRDNAMRSVEQAHFPHPAARPDEARAHIANLLDYKDNPRGELAQRVLMTGSPLYRRMFNKAVMGQLLTAEEQRAGALAVVGTTTTGGFMVPYVFDPTIVPIGAWTSVNPYRAACRIETIVGGNKWQAVAAGVVTPTRGAEAAVATEAGPVFEAPSITVQRVQTFITYSIETEQDRPDIASEMARLIQEGKDTEEELAYTVGDGTSQAPFGLMAPHASVNGFWTVVHTAGAGMAIADVYSVEAAVMLRHRMNAAWFMSRPAIRAFQAVETAGGQLFGGNYYNRVGYPELTPSGNTGLRLLNYPIWETPSGPYSAAADIVIAAFGDPKQFIIVDRIGTNVEIVQTVFGAAQGNVPTGNRGLYAYWRNSAATFGAVGAATTGGVRLANKS
jgi:HK97 family phage major capsid protein